jgi:hypothetical protein
MKKIVTVENVEDNDENVNQFEEMSLFTNQMNMKHIAREFDKNLMPYMRKGGNGKVVRNYISYFILMLVFICKDLNLYHII